MKISIQKLTVAVVSLLATAGLAQATLIQDNSVTLNEAIPQGNAVGIANTLGVSDPGGAAIQDVSVNLDISGGYDGNLYGYLVFQPTGGGAASMEVLLNQIGTSGSNPFGDPTAGMNVTLSDSGGSSIHNGSGTALFPATMGGPLPVFTPDSANTFDNTFGGQSADGTWTLFLADLTSGGGTSELVSWGVDISVVPEPVTWALIGFAALLLTLRLIYSLELKARATRFPGAFQTPASKEEGTV